MIQGLPLIGLSIGPFYQTSANGRNQALTVIDPAWENYAAWCVFLQQRWMPSSLRLFPFDHSSAPDVTYPKYGCEFASLGGRTEDFSELIHGYLNPKWKLAHT